MDETQLKAAFAAFFITESQDNNGAFAAALKLYPLERDRGEALRIAFEWPGDPAVIVELERLKADGVRTEGIPTKEEVIAAMWSLVQNERTLPKDKAMTTRLIAEMLNFIPKNADIDDSKRRMPTAPQYAIVKE